MVVLAGFSFTAQAQTDVDSLPRVKQQLVDPPMLSEHDQVSTGQKVVQVKMEIIEKKMVIDEAGTEIWAFTYNGTVPGPMIVAHQGDYIELTLVNKSQNSMVHNIDFHASTGAMGGGALTDIAPGEEVVYDLRQQNQVYSFITAHRVAL